MDRYVSYIGAQYLSQPSDSGFDYLRGEKTMSKNITEELEPGFWTVTSSAAEAELSLRGRRENLWLHLPRGSEAAADTV